MNEFISREEAAEALRLVEASRASFRSAIRACRGYQHLWVWGGVWIAQCLYIQLSAHPRGWVPNALVLVGIAGSMIVGRHQAQWVRKPIDRRFLGALATLIGFGALAWPLVLAGHRPLPQQASQMYYAYTALVAMQCYALTGIWFDNHLLWVGLLLSLLIVAGYLFFLPWFWWWMALFAGGGLVASGFYVRSAWK